MKTLEKTVYSRQRPIPYGALRGVLGDMPDEDLKQTIDRGSFAPTVNVQLQIYLQALLIFFGKATIYLRVMNRPLPPMIAGWIG